LLMRGLQWWPDGGRMLVLQTGRLTVAAVVSYLIAHAIFPTMQPLTGPLTALLVVQTTLFATLTTSVQRVLSVVSGVVLAVLVSVAVGLTWWSLGLVIAASLVVGQLLRLREHLLEVPISAMLILGVYQTSIAATERIVETLIGAAVGVLINVVFPPPLRSRTAGQAVEEVATQGAELLTKAARELTDDPSQEQAFGWLVEVRDLSRFVDVADRAITEAIESRRLNPRAMREVDTEPILRSGLDSLEHSVVALRALFRSMADGIREAEDGTQDYDPELRGAIAVLLEDLAEGLRTYGALVRADADRGGLASDAALAQALDALRETRAVLTELLLVNAADDRDQWTLSGALLGAVDRVLRELDLEERDRQRQHWASSYATGKPISRAISQLRYTTRAGSRRVRWRRPGDR
jgi:uncharacterized membrane protein YccC